MYITAIFSGTNGKTASQSSYLYPPTDSSITCNIYYRNDYYMFNAFSAITPVS